MAFAKLFETEDLGQVLVKIDTNEDCLPEVRFYFEPPGLGVCSIGVNADTDSHEDWNKIEMFFDSVDEEVALRHVRTVVNQINGPGLFGEPANG